MAFPLIAVAVGAGIIRGAYGAYTNRKNSQYNKSAIKRAYGVASEKLGLDQAEGRQGVNESLNARGILTAGGSGGPMSKIGAALKPGATPIKRGDGTWYAPEGATYATTETLQRGFYDQAGKNSLGGSNTLSGQVNRDTTDEMYRERRDLWQGRVDALKSNSAATQQGYIDAASAGINTAATIYGIGKSFQGGASAVPQLPVGGPQVSTTSPGTYNPGPLPTIKGAMGLPVNPVFGNTPSPSRSGGTVVAQGGSNSLFNVGRGPKP